MTGPTGCGKTLLVSEAAKILNVPFVSADATALTAAGYTGDNVEKIISNLVRAANNDIRKAETGIVFLDEFDKLATRGMMGSQRDVGGEEVQNALLKMLEGRRVEVEIDAGGFKREVPVDTKNILFICAGAFSGMKRNTNKSCKVGFALPSPQNVPEVQNNIADDLVKFGIIPELIGRLPVVAELKCLNEEDLIYIMRNVDNSIIKEYESGFSTCGVKLVIEDDALREIARLANERMIGARGLRSIMQEMMLDIMYTLPQISEKTKTCTVTLDTVYSGIPIYD